MSPIPPTLEVVVLVGIPASGKTTFYRTRYSATHAHVSKDNFPNARRRDERQARLIDEALGAGRPVVVDNTSPTVEARAAIIAVAQQHGARVVGYWFATPLADALARNALREGRARVPDVAVRAIANRMRRPRLDEGFDALYVVRLVETELVVEPWEEEGEKAW